MARFEREISNAQRSSNERERVVAQMEMARLDPESSNLLFQELSDWEHQLQHLDGIREHLAGDNNPGMEP